MIIWSEFRMGPYRDDDHRKVATHFSFEPKFAIFEG